MRRLFLLGSLCLSFVLTSPAQPRPAMNPLLNDWDTPFGAPPFGAIRNADFAPAYREAIRQKQAEVEAIAGSAEAPTFANTIEALDRSGALLDKVSSVFSNLNSAETSEERQAIAREVTPLTTALADEIVLNAALFARVQAVFAQRAALGLSPEQLRLVEETHKRFVRGGASLDAAGQTRLRAVNERLALLQLRFGENVLKETNDFRLVVDRAEDLAGLPAASVAAAAEEASRAGLTGKWVFTLQAPSIWPFLTYAENRELRRALLTGYLRRGDNGGPHDNNAVLTEIAALRGERARLLGYATHADYVLEERMARTPEGVYGLLDRLWAPALERARRELAQLQTLAHADDPNLKVEAWDWRYYADRYKKAQYALDDNALRPYFPLERVRDGAFYAATQLYGITFEARPEAPVYHPEVQAYEVKDLDGSHLGLILLDYHPRPGKRAGAWMSNYRSQRIEDGRDIRPIVVNVGNFTRPTAEAPALLTMDEVETLFHEFGHGLHGLFSRIHYTSLGSVPRDFVELPSQIMEHWATQPEMLKVYARHYQTGEPLPEELMGRLLAAAKVGQGFATVEYLAASYLDMAWHTLKAGEAPADAGAFERRTLGELGLLPEIPPRYRSAYFQHIFSGGYSAGYYAYIWSEVLDTDGFTAFREKGIFDRETARSFRVNVLERGGTADAMDMYRAFRGREPSVDALLEHRGLLPEAAEPSL